MRPARAPARRIEHVVDDVEGRQARRRHRAVRLAGLVMPPAILVLHLEVEVAGLLEAVHRHFDADFVGFAHGEDRPLRHGEVVVGLIKGVAPSAVGVLAGLEAEDVLPHLLLEERLLLGPDEAGHIGKPHDADGNRVTAPEAAVVGELLGIQLHQVIEALAHDIVVRVLAHVGQGHEGEGRVAGGGPGILAERPVRVLLVDEELAAPVDGALDVLVGHGPGLARPCREECHRQPHP